MAEAITAALSTVGLIFGGCCSNVFALEAMIKKSADSGLLITFFQFLFTTAFSYISQLPPSLTSGTLLRPRTVPLHKWAIMAAMFFAVNMLNNWAFAFNISVPVHIILRSFGSVTTMAAGWVRGKKYSALQISSVGVLTLGVGVSAWADAVSKGKDLSAKQATSTTDLTCGLLILLLAQILSAYMGIYVQDTYAQHGADWKENLFYSHFLSLPFFLPLFSTLQRQYSRLASTPALGGSISDVSIGGLNVGLDVLPAPVAEALAKLPVGLVLLGVNAATQLACISGVNILSANASAVTVTIVLNIRKLVSFVFSTWLFGHELSGLMALGAGLVFGSGALYGWETSWRIPQQRKKSQGNEKEKKAI